MNNLPKSILDAIESLSDLPGIGHRSAERLVFSLLKNESGLDQRIAENLKKLKESICECSKCFNYSNQETNTETQICEICKNQTRDKKTLCIVETPLDLIALEKTHEFDGLYHVLHGVISPLNKVKPENLRIPQLFKRIKNSPEIEEIILALAGNVESDATTNFISENLKEKYNFTGKISILSRGIPSGGDLDYLDAGTIGRAVRDRREF
ncbi:MAG: recombination mediator RecR [Candidatus Peregrinibacteria bacterium]|nr:recombination mediator RecR [Candidatus Peregrinibacteria bacterium]